MPWNIQETDGKHCVYKEGEVESLHCYDNKQEAEDYMAALYANENKAISNRRFADALKIGSRNNANDQGRMQQIHDLAVENGATCPEMPEITTMPMMSLENVGTTYYGDAVKALGDGKIGGYLVRYGSSKDLDLTEQYFDRSTNYGSIEIIPVFYQHGLDAIIGKRQIGKGQYKSDDVGLWIEAQLNMRDEYEKAIYGLVEAGKLGWSSGTASHLMEFEQKDGAEWIKTWIIVEASLTPAPAEPRNSAIPIKSLNVTALELPKGAPEAEQFAAGDGNSNAIQQKSTTLENSEVLKMEITEEKLAEMIKSAVTAVMPPVGPDNDGGFKAKGDVKVTHDEADNPFLSLAAQCSAVKSFEISHENMAPRLKALTIKATGASEGQASEGGFLLEPILDAEVLKPMHETGPFSAGATRLPVSGNSNYGWINGVDETDRATGSRWGGIRGYRLAEGNAPTGSRPKFRRINWELKKYAVLCYATDELLADAAQFSAIVRIGAAEELNFMLNDDIVNGLGNTGPLGILASGALVSVGKETGQAAATIVYENLVKMWARLHSRSKANSAWFINTDTNPQLDTLMETGGTSVLMPRFIGYDAQGTIRIKGRPVIETEFNATLGTQGDIILADLSQYLTWEKGGVQAASSIHVQFLTDEEVFRFIYRCDGQPAIASPLTPYKGTATLSPFVALDTRA